MGSSRRKTSAPWATAQAKASRIFQPAKLQSSHQTACFPVGIQGKRTPTHLRLVDEGKPTKEKGRRSEAWGPKSKATFRFSGRVREINHKSGFLSLGAGTPPQKKERGKNSTHAHRGSHLGVRQGRSQRRRVSSIDWRQHRRPRGLRSAHPRLYLNLVNARFWVKRGQVLPQIPMTET